MIPGLEERLIKLIEAHMNDGLWPDKLATDLLQLIAEECAARERAARIDELKNARHPSHADSRWDDWRDGRLAEHIAQLTQPLTKE